MLIFELFFLLTIKFIYSMKIIWKKVWFILVDRCLEPLEMIDVIQIRCLCDLVCFHYFILLLFKNYFKQNRWFCFKEKVYFLADDDHLQVREDVSIDDSAGTSFVYNNPYLSMSIQQQRSRLPIFKVFLQYFIYIKYKNIKYNNNKNIVVFKVLYFMQLLI